MKEHKSQLLAQAISHNESEAIKINPDDIIVESSYSGPILHTIDDVTSDWIVSMMKWQKEQKNIHKKYATMIIIKAMEIF